MKLLLGLIKHMIEDIIVLEGRIANYSGLSSCRSGFNLSSVHVEFMLRHGGTGQV
jgi:hypothetical protein